LAELLDIPGLELVGLDDVHIEATIIEDGETYADNALAKARGYGALAGLPTLADDSGLEVDALNGVPGVHSARYGGGLSDAERNARLLEALAQVAPEDRTARFRCVIALVWQDGREQLAEGVCDGRITSAPRGSNGFGFDPLFYVPEYDATMAELPRATKNRISHRAKAAAQLRCQLVP